MLKYDFVESICGLQQFRKQKWKTRYPCPHLSTILDKIKWNRKPPSPYEAARRAKTRDFSILDLGGGVV